MPPFFRAPIVKTTTPLLFLLTLLLPLAAARAQTSGCTDPRATNYNAAATLNDGSCQYATTTTALVTKAPLDAAVPESSGLQFTSQGLWTFNDSGNLPVLFKVDSTTGNVLQQVTISNFSNVDWEDIAARCAIPLRGRLRQQLRQPDRFAGAAGAEIGHRQLRYDFGYGAGHQLTATPTRPISAPAPTTTISTAKPSFIPTIRCTSSPRTGRTCAPNTTPSQRSPAPT